MSRVAVAQIEPRLGEVERNLETCLSRLAEAAGAGAELIVLPECAIPGYMFDSAAEALDSPRRSPGRRPRRWQRSAVASASMSSAASSSATATASTTPPCSSGRTVSIGTYRKTHLPYLGVDRFAVPGDGLRVFDTPLGRIGLEICYDLRFPEATRTLALQGADIVAHPTAFPVEARIQTELITVARAAENRIYLLTANRVGKERRGEFCGWSQIVDPVRQAARRSRGDGGSAPARRRRRGTGA